MYLEFYNFLSSPTRILKIVLVSFLGITVAATLATVLWLAILLHQFLPLVPALPTLLGFEGTKNYLILFQNNMELRPGGGFIGSYATTSVHNGKFAPLEVHNTYDSDGQLKKHVEPYYIGRRFLQVHLYMRDSNFDVDFVKNAQKVASMYHLETGQKADMVVAIDLSYVKSIVAMLSPIYVWQYNKTVNADNFFWLTEFQADKHSFYGSTQKQDFLQRLFESMHIKLQQRAVIYIAGILKRTVDAIQQKHVLIASTDSKLQSILKQAAISSPLYDPRTSNEQTVNDFFGINEANIGVNKSNYFLTRTIKQDATITLSGIIHEKVTITYHNASPKEEWPTGRYIPYIRLILPHNAKLVEITINGKQQHIVPAVTDFLVYEAPYFTPPDGLEVDRNEEEGKTIYGFRTLVSYHTTQIVQISYMLANKVDISKPQLHYSMFVFKQPGTDNDPYTFSLIYPSTYKTATSSLPINQTHNVFTYRSSLLTDKQFTATLSR